MNEPKYPYAEGIRNKFIGKIEKLELELPSNNIEFNAGISYAKGSILKLLKEIPNGEL